MEDNEFLRKMSGKVRFVESCTLVHIGKSALHDVSCTQFLSRKGLFLDKEPPCNLNMLFPFTVKKEQLVLSKCRPTLNNQSFSGDGDFAVFLPEEKLKEDRDTIERMKILSVRNEVLSKKHKASIIYDILISFIVFPKTEAREFDSILLIDAIKNFPSS